MTRVDGLLDFSFFDTPLEVLIRALQSDHSVTNEVQERHGGTPIAMEAANNAEPVIEVRGLGFLRGNRRTEARLLREGRIAFSSIATSAAGALPGVGAAPYFVTA